MVKIEDIARFIVLRLLQRGNSISHLKLQKLLYYLQAWVMVHFDRAKIFENTPEAWVNGPVYREIYEIYRYKNLHSGFEEKDVVSNGMSLEDSLMELKEKMGLDEKLYQFIESFLNHYGSMTEDYLVFLSHSQQPWKDARKDLKDFQYSGNRISLDSMYEYYSKSIKG